MTEKTIAERLAILKYRARNLRSLRDSANFELKEVESQIRGLELLVEARVTEDEVKTMRHMKFIQS